ncbi:hypothetical protein ACYPKM_05325 [Pseudomonas aeruginosa]
MNVIEFNCITGDLTDYGRMIDPDQVLQFLGAKVNFLNEERFTLLAIKRLVEKYPHLKFVHQKLEAFCQVAQEASPKIGLIGNVGEPREGVGLILSAIRGMSISHFETYFPRAHRRISLKAEYRPGLTVRHDTHVLLSLLTNDGQEMTINGSKLRDYFFLPITLGKVVHTFNESFLVPGSSVVDQETGQSIQLESELELTLLEMILGIMTHVDVRDDATIDAENAYVRERLLEAINKEGASAEVVTFPGKSPNDHDERQ